MLQEHYLSNAIGEIPRILSLTDRNPSSPTYGCMYRVFWHDKATDIACAHPQLNVLALALSTQIRNRKNPYFMNQKIIETSLAALDFWSSIQNKDGSFNEHYPNEHSYGATAWTLSSVVDSYAILSKFMTNAKKTSAMESMIKAGNWLGKNEDPGPLTNHQAIAAWSLFRLSKLTGDGKFFNHYQKELGNVLNNQSEEGWYMEYDGPDLGYLTTSISFMAKIYTQTRDERILDSLKKAVEFSSYFIYPDNSFGGVIGYRDTVHFHPHGFELTAKHIPMSASLKSAALAGLASGRVLRPSYMDDKYFGNLVIELLRAYTDYQKPLTKAVLPCKRQKESRYFESSKIRVEKNKNYYFVCNMSKGGAFRMFKRSKSISDSGILGITRSGGLASTSWINKAAVVKSTGEKLTVRTNFSQVSRNHIATRDMIASRMVMSTIGNNQLPAYLIKKFLIKKLITKSRKLKPTLEREIHFGENNILVKDTIENRGRQLLSTARAGTFYHRYVPASRYFDPSELESGPTKFRAIKDRTEFSRTL